MLLTCFRSYLTKNAIYGIARNISLDLNIAFKVKILENQSFNKYLPPLGKSLSSVKS